MNKIYLNGTVSEDGTLTIPAFAVRGLGYEPEDNVNLTLPVNQCLCDCTESEVFISRCCGDADCGGYTSDGDELNIPQSLLCEAAIPNCSDISIITANGLLLIISATDELEDLTQEMSCFLGELGINATPINDGGGHYDCENCAVKH